MPSMSSLILSLSLISFKYDYVTSYVNLYDEGTGSTPTELNLSMAGENRIANGRPISTSDEVHVVFLNTTFNNGERQFCGGSLLSGDAVVTAAHCIYDLELPSNRVWSIDVTVDSYYRDIREGQGEIVPMLDTFVHPGFNDDTGEYDVAVVRLKRNVTRSEERIYTPLSRREPYLDKTGQAKIFGWGMFGPKSARSDQLLVADKIKIVDIRKCKISYAFTVPPWKHKFKITNTNICAKATRTKRGMKKQQACEGDSGGPLIRDRELIGVVSWGWGRCTGNNLEVIVKVSAVWEFIDEAVKLVLDGDHQDNQQAILI